MHSFDFIPKNHLAHSLAHPLCIALILYLNIILCILLHIACASPMHSFDFIPKHHLAHSLVHSLRICATCTTCATCANYNQPWKHRALLAISVSLERARLTVNYHIDSGIMLAIVLIKKINSLFAMGIFNKENLIFIGRRE